ncbi:O-antigen ligase [Bordetella sp. BOR01]|uniref:O-antigen ligase family protein n=1 Tax=Bordetella sp. BOR01 TaxID=2854779 RepID=UPI001C4560E2|nr:O-antigen ligase family protein [Bordetella sp. BOR01]MBV7485435.1 O-antigen ligase family protein [Bordetella sp. BOR01]
MTYPISRYTTWVAILVGLLPVLTLTIGGGSGLFYLLALICALVLAATPAPQRWQPLRPYRHLALALCLPLVAAVFSQLLNAEWSGAEIERGLRIALGFPCLLAAFLLLDRNRLRQFAWGPLIAGLAATAVAAYLTGPMLQRPLTPQFNAVGYGNLMLLMAVLCLYSLGWQLTRRPKAERVLKIAVVVVTFGGFILTQTRTGWMAIPVFAAIGLVLARWPRQPLRAVAVLVAIVLAAAAIGASSSALRERVANGVHEIRQCLTVAPTADTSMCIRLQLWGASAKLIAGDPWSGIGGGASFAHALQRRAAAGEVSPYVADNFGEPHNDLLMALVTYGLPGGIALLVLYLAPAWSFVRRLRYGLPQAQRTAAAMGLAVCLGFAVFGLTELMFRGMRSVSLYITLIALLTALSAPASSQARDLGPE